MNEETLNTYFDSLGETLGEALLTPTKIYVKALKAVRDAGITIKGCSHITGGGFYENIPRMLPEGVRASVRKSGYPIPPIFEMLQSSGGIEEQMMYNTFNMGLGMILAVEADQAEAVCAAIESAGEKAYVVGEILAGEKGVDIV